MNVTKYRERASALQTHRWSIRQMKKTTIPIAKEVLIELGERSGDVINLTRASNYVVGGMEAFLEDSFKRKLKQDLVGMLPKAGLMFWRGKRAEPMYKPPPSLGCPEGNTEVDLTILAEKAIIFVEAKYHSDFLRRVQLVVQIEIR